jgi:hypothetical protein
MVPSIVTFAFFAHVGAATAAGAITETARADAKAMAANLVVFFIRECPFMNIINPINRDCHNLYPVKRPDLAEAEFLITIR